MAHLFPPHSPKVLVSLPMFLRLSPRDTKAVPRSPLDRTAYSQHRSKPANFLHLQYHSHHHPHHHPPVLGAVVLPVLFLQRPHHPSLIPQHEGISSCVQDFSVNSSRAVRGHSTAATRLKSPQRIDIQTSLGGHWAVGSRPPGSGLVISSMTILQKSSRSKSVNATSMTNTKRIKKSSHSSSTKINRSRHYVLPTSRQIMCGCEEGGRLDH